jgi:hypothetical protein
MSAYASRKECFSTSFTRFVASPLLLASQGPFGTSATDSDCDHGWLGIGDTNNQLGTALLSSAIDECFVSELLPYTQGDED